MIAYVTAGLVFGVFFVLSGILVIKKKRGLVLFSGLVCAGLSFLLYHSFVIHLFIVYVNFLAILYVLALQDFKTRYITEWQVIFFAASAVLLRVFLVIPFWLNVISVVFAFGVLFLPYKLSQGRGLGIGDVIVFTILAINFTPVEIVIVFLFTTIGAVVFGILFRIINREQTQIPLIPFFWISTFLFIPFKNEIISFLGIELLYNLQFVAKNWIYVNILV
jgi:Flp pilus assembly protein protease CpaA